MMVKHYTVQGVRLMVLNQNFCKHRTLHFFTCPLEIQHTWRDSCSRKPVLNRGTEQRKQRWRQRGSERRKADRTTDEDKEGGGG